MADGAEPIGEQVPAAIGNAADHGSLAASVLHAFGKRSTHSAKAARYFFSNSAVLSSESLPCESNFSCARNTRTSGCGMQYEFVNSNAWRSWLWPRALPVMPGDAPMMPTGL